MSNDTRYIAYAIFSGMPVSTGETIEAAMRDANRANVEFLTVLDCGYEGKVFWSHRTRMNLAMKHGATVVHTP